MPLSKDKMREYQAKRRQLSTKKAVVNPIKEILPFVNPLSTVVNPVTIEMFEALDKRVSDLEARLSLDRVVKEAMPSGRRGSNTVLDGDLFRRVMKEKEARLGVR